MNDTQCVTEGCTRTYWARGLCNSCYTKQLKNGTIKRLPDRIPDQCKYEGCERDAKARGWCNAHYERWRKHGTTEPYADWPTPAERLAAKLERKPNGCLEWTGLLDYKGYGRIKIGLQNVSTHRLAWELAHGPIPDGLHVRHFVCDNPPCCDPAHLKLGTHAENMADRIGKTTHCRHGHVYDEANAYYDSDGRLRCRACKDAKRKKPRVAS